MRVSLSFFVLSFFIIYSKFKEILTYSQITQFNGNSSLGGYTCPVNYIVFELEKSMSKIHCAGVCHSYSTCRRVFYQPETRVCVRCSAENEADISSTPSLSLSYERSDTRTCSKNSCYLFVPVKQTWGAAKKNCAMLGGVLVDIISQEEQDFLNNSIPLNVDGLVYGQIWIGGTDREKEGVFVWVDGTPIGYENWNPGQPNDYGHQDCIGIGLFKNMWNDNKCSSQLWSICEFK